MNVVLVLSDSLTTNERTEIVGAIEEYGEWIALSRASYAIRTALSAEALATNLKRRAGVDQGLYVVSVSRSYEGHAPIKVKEWLVTGAEGQTDAEADSSMRTLEDQRVQRSQDRI